MSSPALTQPTCPLCETGTDDIYKHIDSEHDLAKCPRCDLAFIVSARNTDERIRSQYVNNEASPTDYFVRTEQIDINHFNRLFDDFEGHTRTGRLLDIGCSTGTALAIAAERGWEVTGVEPNPASAEIARSKGFKVHESFFDEGLEEELGPVFDVVLLSDVIEHVPQPLDMLRRANRVLQTDGIVVIVTINFDSWLCRKYQIKPSEHPVYFSPKSLDITLSMSGFVTLACQSYVRDRDLSQMAFSSTETGGAELMISRLVGAHPLINAAATGFMKLLGKDELLGIGRKVDG